MKSLFCTSSNLFWTFGDDGTPEASVELCLSIFEKQIHVGIGGTTDSVNYETCRFSVTGPALTILIRALESIRDDLDAESAVVKPIKRPKRKEANDRD